MFELFTRAAKAAVKKVALRRWIVTLSEDVPGLTKQGRCLILAPDLTTARSKVLEKARRRGVMLDEKHIREIAGGRVTSRTA